MKRFIPLLLALLCLCGCTGRETPSDVPATTAAPARPADPSVTDQIIAPLPEPAKLTLSYTDIPVAEPDADISGGYTPAVDLMLWTDRAITDLRIVSLGFDERGHYEDKTLYEAGQRTEADDAFILRMVFWGDIPSTGLAYTDADGSEALYSIGMSGKDGSIVLDKIPPRTAVALTVENITPTGLTLIATAETELVYGRAYWVEREQNGVWTPLQALTDTVAWEAIGILLPADTPTEIKLSWSALFGSLAPGHYRITKDFGAEHCTAEFVIE